MTNKYTKNKIQEVVNEDGFIDYRFTTKKTPKRWSMVLDIKCPSAQSDSKDAFMKLVYSLIGKKMIVYPYSKLKSKIAIYTSGNSASDLDNMVKSIHDSLQGIVFANDRQIKEISAQLHEDSCADSLEVSFEPTN
jgi:Holliday junction resolvase RusA-like endonuclease